jgi:hypothetical protein
MKRLALSFAMAIAFILSNAQTTTNLQAIKITTYNAKYLKSESGTTQYDWGTMASTIAEPEFGGAVVYFRVDIQNFKAIKAKYRMQVVVMEVKDGKESINYQNDMFIPTKNGWTYVYSQFSPGTYNVQVRDKDNPDDVYNKVSFTVTGRPKIDYKNNSTLVVCQSVDDNWNPVGLTTHFKAGQCMNFLYKAKDKMSYITMLWNVVRVKADGTEEYVTHLEQGAGNKPFRWLATESGICVFNTPGKYRIYLFEKESWDNRHDEDSKYVGKGEFTVD